MYDGSNLTVGTIATHTCTEGFALDGQSTRTCLDDDQADTIGVWSEVAPSCRGVFGQLRGLLLHDA